MINQGQRIVVVLAIVVLVIIVAVQLLQKPENPDLASHNPGDTLQHFDKHTQEAQPQAYSNEPSQILLASSGARTKRRNKRNSNRDQSKHSSHTRICESFHEESIKFSNSSHEELHDLHRLPLNGDMVGHLFVLLGGLHGSGTSITEKLVSSQSWASGFVNTGKPQDEGVFLSEAAPAGVGGQYFQCTNSAFITETKYGSFLLDRDKQTQLFKDWRKHWDLSMPVLVEKTPTHVVQIRWFQAILGGYKTSRFIMLMRHPAKTWHQGEYLFQVQGFISAHEALEADLPVIGNIIIFQYERLFDCREEIFRQISRLVDGRDIVYHVAGDGQSYTARYPTQGHRKLIGLHGSSETPMLSAPNYDTPKEANVRRKLKDALDGMEARIRVNVAGRLARFGYDLANHTRLVTATAYHPYAEQLIPGLFVKIA